MVVAGMALLAVLAYQAVASLSVATAQEEQTAEVGDQVGQPEQSGYVYEAQPGDTYTQIARKAIQTYGIDNGVNLTQAGIVFAETNLTQEAAAGDLAAGQEITVKGDLVKKWVEAAGKLSEAEQKAWDVYVPFVDFNTDKVGESS